MDIKLDEFVNEVITYAPAIEQPAALLVVRNAIRSMCVKYGVWEEKDTVLIQKSNGRGALITDSRNTEVARVTSVWSDTDTISNWGYDHKERELVIKETLKNNKVSVTYQVTPINSFDSVPDIFAINLKEAVVYGALALAYEMPSRPWSNPEQSVYFKRKHINEIRVCLSDKDKNFIKQNSKIAYRRW